MPSLDTLGSLLLLLAILGLLESRQFELLTNAAGQFLPGTNILVLVPRQEANPWLDVVMKFECNILLFGNLATGVSDLIFGLLVPELKETSKGWLDVVHLGIENRGRNIPAWINRFAECTALEFLHGDRANILEMIGAWVRDNRVPDDSLVGRISGGRPFGGDVYEKLLGVPCEEGGEVGVERELDDSVFFLLGTIVMRATLDTGIVEI